MLLTGPLILLYELGIWLAARRRARTRAPRRNATMTSKKIAIVGAGPIGIEAALYAQALGHDVLLYDRGDVAESVKSWGFVRPFLPVGDEHDPARLENARSQRCARSSSHGR